MRDIATLTLNPTIDVSFEVDRVYHTHKMRGRNERHDPGGGGINVARVKILIYTWTGFLTAVGGIVLTARVKSGQPLLGMVSVWPARM